MRSKTLKVAFRELRAELDQLLDKDSLSIADRFNQAMPKVNGFLEMVRKEKREEVFRSPFEEIYFFKFEKPEYYAPKIFLAAWFALMNARPIASMKEIRFYYHEELRFIARFFQQHAFHYQYYRGGMTELDEILFMRGKEVPPIFLAEVPELDPMFCTSGDYLFAKFIAYEALQEFILKKLEALEAPTTMVMAKKVGSLEWSGELINLVELGYGLYVSGQIGGGRVGLGEIFRWLESSFGVEIGIPANRLREIKRRKRLDKLRFTNLVQERLLAYIEDEDDLNYRGKANPS